MTIRPELKTEIVEASQDVRGTPAEHYLTGRGVLPYHWDTENSVRFLSYDVAPHWQTDRHSPIVPAGYAGAICYIYRTPDGQLAWVETDMLNALGERHPKKKYSFGSPKGAVFGHLGALFGEWHICEGPLDVLTIFTHRPRVGCISMGGTFNQPPIQLFASRGSAFKVFIHSDGDLPGQTWARKTRHYLACHDIPASIVYYPGGHDPNSYITDTDTLERIANNDKTNFPPSDLDLG